MVRPPGGKHQPVHLFAHQLFQMPGLTFRAVGGVAHEHRHALFHQDGFQPLKDRHGKAAKVVVRHQPHGHALAPVQGLGQIIGPKAHVAGHAADPFAHRITDLGALVQRLGHSANADASDPGHIMNGDAAARGTGGSGGAGHDFCDLAISLRRSSNRTRSSAARAGRSRCRE